MTETTEWIFWGGITLVIYSYFVYPLLLLLVTALSKIGHGRDRKSRYNTRDLSEQTDLPEVTVVISAFNEEASIADRITNLLSQEYPPNKLKILIGSDGSTDATGSILQMQNSPRVIGVEYSVNRGKASVLNDLLADVETELVVFTDANTHFAPDALKKLVRHFSDPRVGAVSGELHLMSETDDDNKDVLYWRYERFLKLRESMLDAMLGVNGAIYAIRRELFTPLPTNTIVDDYHLSMEIVKNGYSLLYDPEAMAWEKCAPNIFEEIRRRIRIGIGNYQVFFRMPWALNPLLGWRFISYISHKVIRWFTPHILLLTIFLNLLLMRRPIYLALLIFQLLFYCSAWIGLRIHRSGKRIPSFLMVVVFFVSMNCSLLRGFLLYVTSDLQGNWQRTER